MRGTSKELDRVIDFEEVDADIDDSDEQDGRRKKGYLNENERRILDTLERLGGLAFRDEEDVERGGAKIRIPEGMSYIEAERFLRRKRKAMDEPMDFQRTFSYRPWDGAWCMWNALKRAFGAVSHEDAIRMGFFGPEKEKPSFISVKSGPHKSEQVPWGGLRIPAMPDVLFNLDQGGTRITGPLFHLTATGPRRERAKVEGVFKLVEEELMTNSLYRGKAIDGQTMPEFLDLSSIDPTLVVYSMEAQRQLEANVWTQIEKADELRKYGVATKRCVLLHGEWGTGKTLAAGLTAQVANKHGWTFIRARPGVDDLNQVMGTATLYAPAVVFFEDIDVIADPTTLEADEASKLLDAFDGLAAKGKDVMAVLTTNHIDRIHKGMVRPGRLDAVIQLGALDAQSVVTLLLRHLPEELVDQQEILDSSDAVAEAHVGYTPAYVVESAGRAIRYALAHKNGGSVKITSEDLIASGNGLRNQLELMHDAAVIDPKRPLERELGRVVETTVAKLAGNDWEVR